jgi:hypothetical protein
MEKVQDSGSLPTLPIVLVGTPIPCRRRGRIEELPPAAAADIKRVQRLLEAMIPVVAATFAAPGTVLLVRVGLVSLENGNRQRCVFIDTASDEMAVPIPSDALEPACCGFMRSIAGQPAGGMFEEQIPDHLEREIEQAALHYLRSDGGTTFPSEARLLAGQSALALPTRAAPKPSITPTRVVMVLDGLVDDVGYSSRQFAISDSRRKKKIHGKYDVGTYHNTLCDHLKLRGPCRIRVEKLTDSGGDKFRLLSVESRQADLFQPSSDVGSAP